MWGSTRRCMRWSARFDLRFHAARAVVERQGRPDDWCVDRDEWKTPLARSPPGAGFVVNRCRQTQRYPDLKQAREREMDLDPASCPVRPGWALVLAQAG